MEILVCVKRVPAPGAKIPLTDDGRDLDTRYLGFTIGPHEECAVEEAIRIVESHGGSSTVLIVGPPEADEQIRYALAMGIDHGVHVQISETDIDPQATARSIVEAVTTLQSEGGTFDLILFGNEAADSGNYQVGIRVATALDMPIVAGIKGIEFQNGTVSLRRGIPGGFERHDLPLPAAAAVKEGINLPRYPPMRGRLKAKKTEVRVFEANPHRGGLTKVRLHPAPQSETETVILGSGPDAAPKAADILEELGVV
jgi:electron transfer flavoprotein beta subunit